MTTVQWFVPGNAEETYEFIRRAQRFVGENKRYALDKVLIHGNNVVGTDGRYLYYAQTDTGVPQGRQILLPRIHLRAGNKAMRRSLRYGIEGEEVVLSVNGTIVREQTNLQRFPDWENVTDYYLRNEPELHFDARQFNWKRITKQLAEWDGRLTKAGRLKHDALIGFWSDGHRLYMHPAKEGPRLVEDGESNGELWDKAYFAARRWVQCATTKGVETACVYRYKYPYDYPDGFDVVFRGNCQCILLKGAVVDD